MSIKISVTVQLETSDHDGYCSDNECEYKKQVVEHTICVPNNWKNLADDELIKYLPEPKLNNNGSYYCYVGGNSKLNNLDKHDYKYTILDIRVV